MKIHKNVFKLQQIKSEIYDVPILIWSFEVVLHADDIFEVIILNIVVWA